MSSIEAKLAELELRREKLKLGGGAAAQEGTSGGYGDGRDLGDLLLRSKHDLSFRWMSLTPDR
jgi:hypothetical protein